MVLAGLIAGGYTASQEGCAPSLEDAKAVAENRLSELVAKDRTPKAT